MTSISNIQADADNSKFASQFLEKVQRQASLADLYDARDIAEVVFRTLRDMMTTEAADRVAAELEGKMLSTGDGASQDKLVEIWKDSNPLVRFLSRIRKPLEIEPDTFLFRISQEAGLPRGVTAESATEAVFSALKQELSSDRIQEVASFLPGILRQAWRTA